MRASFAIMPRLRVVLILFFACLTSCANYEELRIRQLLNEKGFGTRAEGRATMENYVTGGDAIVFLINPAVFASPGAERLALLSTPQKIGLDGTILLPYVGPVMVLGLTERDLKRLVESQLESFFSIDIQVEPRILNYGKFFYAFGEVLGKGRIPFLKPDITLLEAIVQIGPLPTANMGRVRVIRPDAENPLVVEVNIREMIQTGNTRYNVLLNENDFIYVPATWIGGFARFIQKLLQPLAVVVQSMFGLAQVKYSYDILSGDTPNYFFRY